MTQLFPDQHHPDLYFEDGNIVFSAFTERGQRQYYRVHRGYLARHSPVLADMFAIPPLKEIETDELKETYDGVVYVQSPDSAEDIASFLSVLYDPL